jgi:hypothetical protein
MPELSRRDLLRASAGAAVAVPMAALVGASPATAASHADDPELDSTELAAAFAGGQVIFSVRDAARGEVAIYHGTAEVVVHDRALVARIVRAANAAHVS